MSTTMRDRHLTDAELFRALEASEPETGPTDLARQEIARHLETCPQCADALRSLESDSRLITRVLDTADFEDGGRPRERDTGQWRGVRREPAPRSPAVAAPAPRRLRLMRSSWLKAAAILVLVAGPLAAFPGVRSWVVEQVTGPEETTPTAAETTGEPTVLRFTPDPGDFLVRFPAGAAGAITVERSSSGEAELRTTGQPETVVSASSLEIRGDGEGRYRLRLPPAVTGAWIVVGDRTVAVNDRQIDRRTVITLDG